MTADPADPRILSARQAAEYCGVDDKTIRAWLSAGKIIGDRHAGAWRIPADQLADLRRQPAPQLADTPRQSAAAAAPDSAEVRTVRAEPADSAPLLEALRQLEAVRRENVQLAGQVGYMQAQLQAAQERIRALEAPREGTAEAFEMATSPERAQEGQQAASGSGPSKTPPRGARRPWWRPW